MAQSPEIQQQLLTLNLAIESRKAKLISEMTQEFKDERKLWVILEMTLLLN